MSETKNATDHERMLKLLSSLTDDELQEMFDAQQELEQRLREHGPQTDDELHEWLIAELGIDIPRTAVCEGHTAPFQFLADIYFERVDAALAVANRGGAKCVAGDTLIYDSASGRRLPIADVVCGELDEVLTVDGGRLVKTPIDYRWYTGENPVLRVRLRTGREIVCTPEHPLLTAEGWRRADELAEGGHIALPSRLPHPESPTPIPASHVDLLALVLAEGCYSQNVVLFSTDDEAIIDMAHRIAADFDGVSVRHRANYDYIFTQGKRGDRRVNPIRACLTSYGIANEKAAKKKIPEAVFKLPADQLARFLSVFWMCDGWISDKEAGIGLASRPMLEDIQHLLLRFGVQSRIRRSAENAWSLIVYNACLEDFSAAIKLWGYKAERLEALLAKQRNTNAGRPALTPTIMATIADRFAQQDWHERRQSAPLVRERLGWSAKMPAAASAMQHGGVTTVSRERLEALCDEGRIGRDGFDLLLSPDLWWDEIVSIEDAGVADTYDLTITSTANFIANDIVSHNTFLVAVLHWLNSLFKPGCESCTFGATEAQSLRCYAHLKGWIYDDGGNQREEVVSSLMRETIFRNGSRVEVLPGTKQAVNGPHPQKAHADEVELMDDDTWRESRNMTVSKEIPTGEQDEEGKPVMRVIKPQDIATSTRKGPNGRVQQLIDEIHQAVRDGFMPPRKLYIWCLKETARQVPNCQVANPDLPAHERCRCHEVKKGEWEDGSPRLLRDICGGDFYRSRGWQPYGDVVKQFLENDKETFEVQQLCAKPEMRHHFVPQWRDEKHCVRGFVPDPANGPIFMSVDWGGCYDGETEVLTARGWVPFPDITEDDEFASLDIETHKVVFQKPEAVMKKEYGGVMERYENRSVDLLVSADHNMLVAPLRGKDRDKWRIVRSDSIGECGDGLRVTRTSRGREDALRQPFVLPGVTAADGRVLPDVQIDPEDWAALLGFWMAEGHTHPGKNNHGERRQSGDVGFTHYDRENIERIKRIAGRYFTVLDRIDYEKRRGQLRICDPRLYAYLAQFGKAGEKFLPDDVKRWEPSLLRIYLDWHMRGGGDGRRIYTGSKRLADDLQEIAMYAGKAATISEREPRDGEISGRAIKANLPQYVVSMVEKRLEPQIASKPMQKPVKSEISSQEWNMGMVYCVHLPDHHTLYVRRNGKPVWSGNTNPHAVNWYQLLKHEVEALAWLQTDSDKPRTVRLAEGTIVCFDEIYIAEIGNDKLANLVKEKEERWRRIFPNWRVYDRFADPQGKAARLDWKEAGLKTTWHTTREFEEHIKIVRDYFDDDLIRVDGERCEMFVREIKQWRRDPRTGHQIDEFNHCVTGDTLVQTRDGLRLAADLAGETVEVLTQGGDYRPAGWRSYGERDVYEVEFEDGEIIRATDGHQWIVQRDGQGHRGTGTERVTTLELEGRRVPTQPAKWRVRDSGAYERGVQHGLVYGDGTAATIRGRYSYSWMHQYGEENCALVERFFPGRHGERRESPHGVKISTKTLPVELKSLPEEGDPDYVRGFIAGLIAADGAVNKQGCCYISSSKRDDINKIVTLCRSVGVVVARVEEHLPRAGSYPNAKASYRIWLTKASLDSTLLLKPSHRASGLRRGKWSKPHNVAVVSVRPAGRAEVFCCEEPETNTFVLGSGKLTSNCMSNFRYALANIKKVARRALRTAGNLPTARAIPRQAVVVSKGESGPIGFKGKRDDFDRWRKSLGEPVTKVRKGRH